MRLKDKTVSIKGLKPELLLALIIVDQVMKEQGQQVVVTSGTEETTRHNRTSSHYNGYATDIRSRNFEHPERVLALCKEALGHNPDIDIFYETKSVEHFHLQFRPKRRDDLL